MPDIRTTNIYSTVKTEKKAIEILMNHGSKSLEIKGYLPCECGESNYIDGYAESQFIGRIVFCMYCGDDDAFDDEVFYQ